MKFVKFLQDRWSIMAVVPQDKFHCIWSFISNILSGLGWAHCCLWVGPVYKHCIRTHRPHLVVQMYKYCNLIMIMDVHVCTCKAMTVIFWESINWDVKTTWVPFVLTGNHSSHADLFQTQGVAFRNWTYHAYFVLEMYWLIKCYSTWSIHASPIHVATLIVRYLSNIIEEDKMLPLGACRVKRWNLQMLRLPPRGPSQWLMILWQSPAGHLTGDGRGTRVAMVMVEGRAVVVNV